MGHPKHRFDVQRTPGAGAALGRLRGDGGRRLTIYDVAEAAGVSAITVSRALNGGSCSPETRERVQSVARKLGYEPNAAAQALAARKRKQPARRGRRPEPASMPRIWQSYAEMMLKLVGAQN